MPFNHPVSRLARRLGFNLGRVRRLANPETEEEVFPTAAYAPWKRDRTFLDAFAAIREATLLDKYRAWILWQLVEQVGKLQGCLIEVGVWRGGSGVLVALGARQCGIADRVYLCDTFRGIVKSAPDETRFPNGALAAPRTSVDQLIERFRLDHVRVLEGVFPDETASRMEDDLVRFCHIDVDVYRSARDVFENVWGRMVVGGVVVFDDYGDCSTPGVIRFVEETRMRHDLIFIHSLAGQAIFVKTK